MVYEMRQGVPGIIETRAQTNVPAVGPSRDSRKRLRIDAAVTVHTSSLHLVALVAHRFRAVGTLAPAALGYFPEMDSRAAAWDAAAAADDPEAAVVGHYFGEVIFGYLSRRQLQLRLMNLLHFDRSALCALPLPRGERCRLESQTCLIWRARKQCQSAATFAACSPQRESTRALSVP